MGTDEDARRKARLMIRQIGVRNADVEEELWILRDGRDTSCEGGGR